MRNIVWFVNLIFLNHLWLFLYQASNYEASGAITKIGLSSKSNHHKQTLLARSKTLVIADSSYWTFLYWCYIPSFHWIFLSLFATLLHLTPWPESSDKQKSVKNFVALLKWGCHLVFSRSALWCRVSVDFLFVFAWKCTACLRH